MKKYSILVVDDEESIRMSVTTYLEDEGYRVLTAESGEKAVEMIKGDYHFDVIITDIMMDGVDGIGVLKEAKKAHPDILVMVLTGYGSLSTAIEALRLGAFDYMQKPCDSDELLMRTKKCIDHLVLNRKIKAFETFLPVCCVCKKIRDDDGREPGKGVWMEPDIYLQNNAGIQISHGYCDVHIEELRKEMKAAVKKRKDEKENK
jgi:CheY-like chemotaxis protein